MMSETSTVTPEVRIKELEEHLGEETERLLKLYSAYEQQEKELLDTKAEVEVLETEIVDREIEKESLESLLTEKDARIRELEFKSSKTGKQVEHLEPELEKMEEKYAREKDRLGKVFSIAEELDNDLRLAVVELQTRDSWYMDHMSLFENLNKAIQNRYEMIEAAAEAERQSQHMGRAIAERVEEMVEARAAEMTIDEASDIDSVESDSSESASTDEGEEDEWKWSENVLAGVMDKNGIKDRDAFIEFAKAYDIDGNRYLKGSEIAAAAVDFIAQDSADQEATADETPKDTDPESSSDWSDGQDPWEGQ
jgi:chromosome segregation ATPase|tara:strand:- start:271 stop:1197 length:927 start_codon:yes stop_codon:yes gene_type:complete